jgi:Bacterial dnaA protein helix-turn-helix
MPRLELPDDGVRTASDVRARAFATFERRRAAYLKLAAEVPPDESERLAEPEKAAKPERPAMNWRPIWAEVARQTGIPTEWLRKGDESRGQPLTAYRQLSMALTLRLTKMGLSAVGRLYGVDHSTVHHARQVMSPVLQATGLTVDDSVPFWVAAALPITLVYVGEYRAKNREHAEAMHGGLGKFVSPSQERRASVEPQCPPRKWS